MSVMRQCIHFRLRLYRPVVRQEIVHLRLTILVTHLHISVRLDSLERLHLISRCLKVLYYALNDTDVILFLWHGSLIKSYYMAFQLILGVEDLIRRNTARCNRITALATLQFT